MTRKRSCGCGGAARDPREEGAEVVWHDPTKYDPLLHGPPYMPSRLAQEAKVVARRVASSKVNPRVARRLLGSASPLSAVLAVLRGAAFVHQTHHWQTSGPSSYADHLLFERLYNDGQAYIDQVAERAVGLGGTRLVDPAMQAHMVAQLVGGVTSESGSGSLAVVSLQAESLVLSVVDEALEVLRSTGALRPGVDNLLQGVADQHETFVYLLQQRLAGAYDYAR